MNGKKAKHQSNIHPLWAYIIKAKMTIPEFALKCRVSPPTILRIIKSEQYGNIKTSKKTIKKILRKAYPLTWKDFGYEEE